MPAPVATGVVSGAGLARGTSWDCSSGECVPRLRGQQLPGSIQFLPSGSGARLPLSSEITREIRIVDVHMKFRNC